MSLVVAFNDIKPVKLPAEKITVEDQPSILGPQGPRDHTGDYLSTQHFGFVGFGAGTLADMQLTSLLFMQMASAQFVCQECSMQFSGPVPYLEHLRSQKHQKMVETHGIQHKANDQDKTPDTGSGAAMLPDGARCSMNTTTMFPGHNALLEESGVPADDNKARHS
ncbi:hypothetical protein HPB51_007580 [Rhipicephalus microplus]|uniref:C2H2-type domain-containing protein n=1 Tax=Rhipicephalus microplus TaxID=6941 RepID=A0A9J6EF66_RHIMP|nr:hypothetical protein HPB51_007580 [Rhipicephalus microplus]